MNYENAKDVLPEELLRELQKYAAGKLIYVPRDDGRRRWGEASGYRKALRERNRSIIREFADGADADSLADMYYLTPETIRKIVYSKKEKEKMELEKIFELYSDNEPLSYEIFEEEDYNDPWWGEIYFKRYTVSFPEGKTEINIFSHYPLMCPERIEQMSRVIEAYAGLGYECPKVLENKYGKLSRTVEFSGHECLVFATECASCVPIDYRKSQINTDELMMLSAKVANMHLSGTVNSTWAIFDKSTAVLDGCDDWIDDNVFGELKDEVVGRFPGLADKYSKLEKAYSENKAKIKKVWESLPTSLFCPTFYNGRYIEENGKLKGLTDFYDGGREICIHYFIISSLTFIGLDKIFAYNDEGFARAVERVKKDLKTISSVYKFTNEEIRIAPAIFKIDFLGMRFYGENGELWYGDEKTVSETLDFIIEKLSADYDFSECMR